MLADCYRAVGHDATVDELWDELRQASPSAELVVEGRIVMAGMRADRGDLPGAIRLLEDGWRLPGRPQEHHLRRGYALADLYERAGDVARARQLFERLGGWPPTSPTSASVAAPWADRIGRGPFGPTLLDAPTLADQTGPPVPDQARRCAPRHQLRSGMTDIQGLLGDEADSLLTHVSKGIAREDLTLPGPDIVSRVYQDSDRSPQVLRNLAALFGHGRLAGTGYVSILPGRPGHRALGGGVVRAEPEVLRPAEHRRAGHRGRLQRGGLDLRRARSVLARATPTASPSSSSSTTTSC